MPSLAGIPIFAGGPGLLSGWTGPLSFSVYDFPLPGCLFKFVASKPVLNLTRVESGYQ